MTHPNPEVKVPKPIAAAAGAGDLAVEKIRGLSKLAADRLAALEADPSAFADQVQMRIETQADALGTKFRSASSIVMDGAKDLSEKAQDAFQTAVSQAEDAYETLARRGQSVVIRLRGASAQELASTADTIAPEKKKAPLPVKKAGTPAKKSTRKQATTANGATRTGPSAAKKSAARRKTAQSATKRTGA